MSNTQTVRRLYQAFTERDLPTVLELLDPSVEWGQPESLPWGGTYRGPEQVIEFLGKASQHIEGLRVDTDEYLESNGTVVALGWVRGVARVNDAPFSVRLAHVWKLRHGKVVWFYNFVDTAALLAAINASPGDSR